jgi:DUF917 family protein
MARALDRDALDGLILGGILLSAGGSGQARAARYRMLGEQALAAAPLSLVALDELADDAPIIIGTGVGAPGFATAVTSPQDAVEAARRLIEATGTTPVGVMPGHVPGLITWMQAARLGIRLVDAATNGRGHPTVKMGGMGLASQPHVAVTQAGCGGAADDRVEITVTGSLAKTATIMRAAAVQNGGLIYAARGPFTARFVRAGGAPGAVSHAIRLGQAMLGAAAGRARLEVAIGFMAGERLVEGNVIANQVRYESGFDLGTLTVEGDGDRGSGRVTLHVYNEFMAADRDGKRLFTFPDMIGSLDPATGEPIAISELEPGRAVAIIAASRRNFPVGAGATDPAVFPEVEEKLGVALR